MWERLHVPTQMPPIRRNFASAGYAALRRYRWSLPDAEYFVTVKTRRAAAALTAPEIMAALAIERRSLARSDVWKPRCWVVMPDHLHMVFSLGPSAQLPDCMRLFKGRTSVPLRHRGVRWQSGYYEHRIRDTEDRLPIFLYIYLNPYRAKLVDESTEWPGFWCSEADFEWFRQITNRDLPMPAWLR
jgi:putative transposase